MTSTIKFGWLLFMLFSSVLPAQQKYTPSELALIRNGDMHTALEIPQTTDSLQHAVLLQTSQDAIPKNADTKRLVMRMKAALIATKSGVGIAAPQVGINRNIIWVKRFDQPNTPFGYYINPVILWRSKMQNLGPEGDLSIPDFRDQFYRSKVIQVAYYDLEGKKHTEIVEGFTAVIFQHEIDHLFGILISNKIKEQQKQLFEKVDAYHLLP